MKYTKLPFVYRGMCFTSLIGYFLFFAQDRAEIESAFWDITYILFRIISFIPLDDVGVTGVILTFVVIT